MSSYLKAGVCGLIGGFLGALIWAGISYLINREIGWIAVGVGFLAGFGVRLGAGENEGTTYGLLAVALSVLALIVGKYMAVSFIVSDFEKKLDQVAFIVTDEDMIQAKEKEVADDWTAKKKQVYAPDTIPNQIQKKYSTAVTAEAKKRWLAIPKAERESQLATETAKLNQAKKNFGDQARKKGFSDSFTPWDILWFILAGLSALGIGAGRVEEN